MCNSKPVTWHLRALFLMGAPVPSQNHRKLK